MRCLLYTPLTYDVYTPLMDFVQFYLDMSFAYLFSPSGRRISARVRFTNSGAMRSLATASFTWSWVMGGSGLR